MSAPALDGRPSLTFRGTRYPVLLPTVRDPRLQLAGVIVSLQVLGQVAFDFQLSIAQILVSLVVAGVLELAITFRRQHVIMWPASALLTGNGVAFVLRVPGTEHGDWWSTNGWWIFAGTSAIALLSKYLIRIRGRHVFNPSNFGLVLCFFLLGAERADPLALWWGPLSPGLVVALVLIVVGGFLILRRLQLVGIAFGFWVAFAAGIGVLAASGHTMTAAWHVGPIEGAEFWWLLVTSPEILVFLFFMITDPKTIPAGRGGRHAYAVAVGLLATLLIAPQTTEFATKVAILAALFVACLTQGVLALVGSERLARLSELRPTRRVVGAAVLTGAFAYGALVVAAGIPARPDTGSARAASVAVGAFPEIVVTESQGVAGIDERTARAIARDVLVDLRVESEALRKRDLSGASAGASGAWLASLWDRIRAAAGEPIAVPTYRVARMQLSLRRGAYQGPPTVVANLDGSVVVSTHGPGRRDVVARADPQTFRRTLELVLEGQRYVIVGSTGGAAAQATPPAASNGGGSLTGTQFDDVAAQVGLTFRHGAFRSGMSTDSTAMMGGGLCWLDFDGDSWLDLFVVNSYADVDVAPSEKRGGLPRSALYRNVGGRFEDVSSSAGADLALRGNGCVAADLNLDGHTDLYVTSAGYNVPTDGYDALLWNNGDGTFTEGAAKAGITAAGWHSAAAVGDVDGNGRPDLFVTSYADPNIRVDSPAGFPSNHLPLRDLLYLNVGTDDQGRSRFREVSKTAGIERKLVGHGLGAVFTDVDRDGRLDLYVANDTDANQLYRNLTVSGGLGFRFEETAKRLRVDDPNAGMGIAAADFDDDGRVDLFVTNSRGQLHVAYRSGKSAGAPYSDARPDIAAVLGTRSTAWGDSWADLDLDGDLDLALANGGIPIVNLAKDAQRITILENVSSRGGAVRFAPVTGSGLQRVRPVNGRGLAAADFDNDGDLDIAVNAIGGQLVLLENKTRRGHWLEVRLNRFAPGAQVTAILPGGRRLVREVLAGSSYLSSEDPRVHFGLGDATTVARLAVRFPDGTTTRLRNVTADRVVEVGPAK